MYAVKVPFLFVYLEQRKAESSSIRLKYPERVPVSIRQ